VTGIFVDFDGTLSDIVDEPSAARPVPGAAEVLDALAASYARVGVMSGRPVDFLAPWFSPSVILAGLYGLETVIDGQRHDHPLGGAWREVVEDVASVARVRGPDGLRVESKGLSLTLHYRGRPDLADEVMAFAALQATRSGLECRPARMSVELHPPIPADKGTAVLDLSDGLSAVAYAGDDVGDLPAFAALARLRDTGASTVAVAVRSPEASTELLEAADVVVDGPNGVVDFLASLVIDAP
jgi:trehalose 6-phosphate phosphatase